MCDPVCLTLQVLFHDQQVFIIQTLIRNFVHDAADKKNTKSADRSFFDRQIDFGVRNLGRIE